MITVRGLTCQVGRFRLHPVDLDLAPGDYWILLGPTGSGKSILLSLLAGLVRPNEGQILKDGMDITHLAPEKRRFSMVVQDFALFPHLTVFENIAFSLRVRRCKEIRQAVHDMASRIGIAHLLDRGVEGLSGGEKQRVALARALVISPELLLLDEPLSALDQMTRRELMEELRRVHRATRIPVLHVTHDFEEGMTLGNRMAVIHQGKILQQGTPEQLSLHPATPLVAAFVGIRNIFQGTVVREGERFFFRKERLAFEVPAVRPGKGAVALPSEDLVLSLAPVASSARNILQGEVREIRLRPPLMDVLLEVNGWPLTATVTRETVREMDIRPGLSLFVTFKVAAVKVFETDQPPES